MKLVNLKSDADEACCAAIPMEAYGWGLRLMLGEDHCEKLGITKGLKAGTEVTIRARALVCSSTESLNSEPGEAGNSISVSLQITDMGAEVGGVVRNAARELYPNSDMS